MTSEVFLESLKVINDPTRLSIIRILCKNGTLCACKILDELSITQGTLSHHMKVMVRSGLVKVSKEGKWCFYTIEREKICEIAKFMKDICTKDNCDTNCCK